MQPKQPCNKIAETEIAKVAKQPYDKIAEIVKIAKQPYSKIAEIGIARIAKLPK